MPPTTIDLQRAAESKLDVCPKCGWYNLRFGGHVCLPDAGAEVDLITEASGDLAQYVTRLGYGCGQMVFELSERLMVSFAIDRDCKISLHDVWSLDELSIDQVVRITRAVKEILGK